MVEMTLNEAQLFRSLVSVFGRDNVVWSMSVLSVCGGEVPDLPSVSIKGFELVSWAEEAKCLFTIVDHNDNPKMVLELSEDLNNVIDLSRIEHRSLAEPLLKACGIRYVQISIAELTEALNPESSLDLISLLEDKVLGNSPGSNSEEISEEI